jgi:4a-hydroxytetrahydrobiopterin dehydratase
MRHDEVMTLLTESQRQEFAASYPDWELGETSITRTFQLSDFIEAMGFVNRVALLAEKAFHHPDIDIRWNRVTLTLSTHSEGGLTGKDVDLAASIDARA